jgi:hypothetical protein
MAGWQDIKAKMLAKVHATFEHPAVYLLHGGADPLQIVVRFHKKFQNEPVIGFREFGHGANTLSSVDSAIFKVADFRNGRPSQNAFLWLAEGVFRIGPTEPPMSGYVRAELAKVTGDDLARLEASQDFTLPAWVGIVA